MNENHQESAITTKESVSHCTKNDLLYQEKKMSTKDESTYPVEELLKRRFFFCPSFAIYGGISGLYDYGPPGTALMNDMIQYWRKHFVVEEGMLECDTTILTPHIVLKASGHVDRFTDHMVKDTKTNDIFRADHVLKHHLEALEKKSDDETIRKKVETDLATLDDFDGTMLDAKLEEYNVLSENENPLSKCSEFNLMFKTDIGPAGLQKAYLRPETAQGQFVNFKKFLETNNNKMPFATTHIGKSFRNEISPRSGLLRVREFTMAEIEHYVHPNEKTHPKFVHVESIVLPLLPREIQLSGSSTPRQMAIGTAVAKKIIDNETLGYFLGRIYTFLLAIGIHPDKIRFRQHLANEMAHYAQDCWDAELFSSYGWVECVGCADRSAYDLTVHSQASKVKLLAQKRLETPIVSNCLFIICNKKELGQKFKADSKAIQQFLEEMPEDQKALLRKQDGDEYVISVKNVKYNLPKKWIQFEERKVQTHIEEYVPSVIEPSFGIGRIMYSLLDQCYWKRPEDEQREVLSLSPLVAPTKVQVQPLRTSVNEQVVFSEDIVTKFRREGLSVQLDSSGVSVGKKYSRADEVGTPFCITVDSTTLKNGSVTVRDRDSTKQIRLDVSTAIRTIKEIVEGKCIWEKLVELGEPVLTISAA